MGTEIHELNGLAQIGVYALMAVSLLWAIAAVTLKSLFRSALALAGALLGIAGIYITLRAEFIAAVQVLIYVGSVVTLIIFVIMLTQRLTDPSVRQRNRQSPVVFAAALAFCVLLIALILRTPWPLQAWGPGEADLSSARIGESLLGFYVFPFEVLAVLLTAVLIGAIVIAKKDTSDDHSA
ncbi:MAG: NADH-quinone oxidoreductase subunit J [Candidatus Omnitrophota bacterium]